RTGCDQLAKYTAVKVRGGQAFWTTEAGVHSMGAQYTELYDSWLTDRYQSSLKVIDAFVDLQKTIVLSGDPLSCTPDEDTKKIVSVAQIAQPDWVEKLPNDQQYYFGVGTSEEYYYESSSWQRAEHNAFMALVRTSHSTVVSLQKKSIVESQDLFNEDVDVLLKNVEIVSRWRDIQKKVFYVLARTKR
ncbi:MAG: LPP20 family lipoprotein, partial [Bacteriovoracaceae bacterium]